MSILFIAFVSFIILSGLAGLAYAAYEYAKICEAEINRELDSEGLRKFLAKAKGLDNTDNLPNINSNFYRR